MIKWRDLPYDQATWEAEDMDVPEFDVYKLHYWNHRWDTEDMQYTDTHAALLTVHAAFRELMMGEEGKPGKKIKVKGRVKRPDRPPENPVVDVSLQRECLLGMQPEHWMQFITLQSSCIDVLCHLVWKICFLYEKLKKLVWFWNFQQPLNVRCLYQFCKRNYQRHFYKLSILIEIIIHIVNI